MNNHLVKKICKNSNICENCNNFIPEIIDFYPYKHIFHEIIFKTACAHGNIDLIKKILESKLFFLDFANWDIKKNTMNLKYFNFDDFIAYLEQCSKNCDICGFQMSYYLDENVINQGFILII